MSNDGTVTVVDVARAAGVSTATAARALGNYGSVRPATLERVRQAADNLGYRPNALARSMITRRTLTIGAVIADIDNPFFSKVIRGITDVARPLGFEVILANSDEDIRREQAAVGVMIDKRVDGMIVAPASASEAAHLADAVRAGSHVVLIDRTVRGLEVDTVTMRNRSAATDAVARLIKAGHRRIGYVSGARREMSDPTEHIEPDISTGGERIAGYLRAMREAGLDAADGRYVRIGGPQRDEAARSAQALLALPDRPTALVAADSIIALGVIDAIRAEGLRIADDVSLVSFDDSSWASVLTPPLSVIAQPAYELGTSAMRALLERIEGLDAPARHTRLPARFIERGSVAAPPA